MREAATQKRRREYNADSCAAVEADLLGLTAPDAKGHLRPDKCAPAGKPSSYLQGNWVDTDLISVS